MAQSESGAMDPIPNRTLCEEKDFPKTVCLNLDKMRDAHQFCDAVIRVDDKDFPVHRCVLAASSLYFHTLFTSDLQDNEEDTFTLKGISVQTFQQLLHFAYTGLVELNAENVNDITMAADMYSYSSLRQVCAKYVCDTIELENTLDYMQLAERLEMSDVLVKADKIFLSNFTYLSKKITFLGMSKEALCRYVSSEDLLGSKEYDVFQGICTWLNHKPERMGLVLELMKNIRFGLMSSQELGTCMRTCDILKINEECMGLLCDGLEYRLDWAAQPLTKPLNSLPRGEDKMVLAQEDGIAVKSLMGDDEPEILTTLPLVDYESFTTIP